MNVAVGDYCGRQEDDGDVVCGEAAFIIVSVIPDAGAGEANLCCFVYVETMSSQSDLDDCGSGK